MADSQYTSRRALLKGLPAAAAAMALPGAAVASTVPPADQEQTPILRLFHRHRAIVKAAEQHVTGLTGDDEDAELARLFYNEADRIEDEMIAIPATCAADFAAKIVIATVEGGIDLDWRDAPIWKEARALVGMSSA